MGKLKVIMIDVTKLFIIFITAIFIFSYGVVVMRNEYQQRIRELTPERAAEEVSLFKTYFTLDHLGD
ncbi:hypothetical protein [Amphibacillus jilinensis]|uniref:hypothetical protein n=1 Tax=Amphibacillus jilinensis TaxID=1216008 RepID=UPI000311AB06|nr:hypothetical protein [Amphibacillus jilinensis]